MIRYGCVVAKISIMGMMLVPLLTGCWDRLEIEDRAVVLGVSIDKAPTNRNEDEVTHYANMMPSPTSGNIRVAIQIALPGRIPLGPGEGGGGGSSNPEQTVWLIAVDGYTLDDAFMKLQQQVSSRIFFGHLRVIVMSESYAKTGIDNVNDYFHRNTEVRRMAWLLVAKDSAISVLRAAPKLERIPTLYLMSTLDESIKLGKFPRDYIGVFWSNSAKKGQEGYLPYVTLREQQNVETIGLAYFRGTRMVGKTNPVQIGSFMAIKGHKTGGYRTYVVLEGTSRMVVTMTTHRQVRWKVTTPQGKPHFSIHVELEVNIEEKLSKEFEIDNQRVIHEIQQVQAEQASKDFVEIIKRTQKKGSDIFGFGEYIRAKKPRYWNDKVKTKEKWQEAYKKATFDIHTVVNIRRVGMKAD